MPCAACLIQTAIYYSKDNWLCQPLAAKTWAKNKSGAKAALLAADAAEQAEAGIPILIWGAAEQNTAVLYYNLRRM